MQQYNRLHVLLNNSKEHISVTIIDPMYNFRLAGCSDYDFINPDGSRVKGNGFRSLLFVLQKLLERVLESLQKCSRERGGMFYSVNDHLSTLTAVTRALQVYHSTREKILFVTVVFFCLIFRVWS